MTTFPELDAATAEAAGETLNLPVRGKTYSFSSSLPMRRGIQIARMREETARLVRAKRDGDDSSSVTPSEASRVELSDESEIQMYLDLIGEDNRAAMETDGVTWPEMLHIGSTLFAWHFGGEGAARIAWEAKPGGDADPPADPPASSGGRKTSRSSSSQKKPSGSKGTNTRSRGATTSTGGASSRRTSTGSTKSTSQTRKS